VCSEINSAAESCLVERPRATSFTILFIARGKTVGGNPVLKAEAFDLRELLGEPSDAPGSSLLDVKDDGSPRRGA
jgi:hypothetical protein